MPIRMMRFAILVVASMVFGSAAVATPIRIHAGFREDRAGWVYVHLQGAPREIGYQDGYLLAPEIDEGIRTMKGFLKLSSGKDWSFYRTTSEKMFWRKLDREYQEEIEGIADGLRARGKRYDRTDILALNGWIDLAWYYIPWFAEQQKQKSTNKPKDSCSAFIATGSYTKDGKIVMAHNAWVDYVIGERWNVIADIQPTHGHRILMDTWPGFIHSGDDFVETDAGILITETTISDFKGFDPKGTPEFVRARKAAQYSNSIDDFVRIMTARNNGAYANDWLVGDTKTNEIARLELGLKNHRVWRTRDGILYGCNYPADEKTAKEETPDFDLRDQQHSANGRRMRWERVGELNKGKIDAEIAKRLLADHYDQANLCSGPDCRTLCGHLDKDPKGIPDAGWGAFYPAGAVQGKVTTSAMAAKLAMWARMGHPCGKPFSAVAFLKAHPEYKAQSPYLRDMPANAWAQFTAAR